MKCVFDNLLITYKGEVVKTTSSFDKKVSYKTSLIIIAMNFFNMKHQLKSKSIFPY